MGILFIEDGTVLAHFCVNVAQKWRETSSNGPTNSASRVKSASQLNAKSSCQSVQRMFKGQRRALESQARTGSCRTSSNNQPSIASRKTCVINVIVSFVKKYGRSLLPAARLLNYLLARGASETRSRVDLYSANNDMILVASQQN